MAGDLRVVKFPKIKRRKRAREMIKSAISIADEMGSIDGYAIVAWKRDKEDGSTISGAAYHSGGLPGYLVSTLTKEILDEFI